MDEVRDIGNQEIGRGYVVIMMLVVRQCVDNSLFSVYVDSNCFVAAVLSNTLIRQMMFSLIDYRVMIIEA